ncbi:MAG TPA: peptidoglycan DD-metalloendopeptidase family protein [Thermoanaerobaculia bacterium]
MQHTDGPTRLRMRVVSDTGSTTARLVDFPDGQVHRFEFERNAWRLKSISDPFETLLSFGYTYLANVSGAPNDRVATMTVTDARARQHTVAFVYMSELRDSIDRGMVVKTVDLAGFGGTARYTLNYATKQVAFSVYHDIPSTQPGAPSGTTTPLPLLQSIALPDQTTYTFAYNETHDAVGWSQGLIRTVTLPTRGIIEYSYALYSLPSQDPCDQTGPRNSSPGVRVRKLGGNSWIYKQTQAPDAAMTPTHTNQRYDCDGDPLNVERIAPVWPRRWVRTSIISPADPANKHTRTDHYFNVFAAFTHDLTGNAFPGGGDYGHATTATWPGLDEARKAPLDNETAVETDASHATGDEQVFLSEQVWSNCTATGDCTNGALQRSSYRQFADVVEGFVARSTLVRDRTLFHDDSGCGDVTCEVTTSNSDYDGAGHFRQTDLTSNFPGTASSTNRTEYRKWTAADLQTTSSWFLNTFTARSRTIGLEASRTHYCFDSSGRITRTRVLAGDARSAKDLLTTFTYAGANVTDEKSYGGDAQAIDTADVPLCSMTLPTSAPQYWNKYSWTGGNGVLRTAHYANVTTGALLAFASLDYTSDSTGLVTASRTPDTLATTYAYKPWGTLESVTPPGEDATTYVYTPATATANAKVTATTTSGTVADDIVTIYEYDSLGRQVRTSRTLPGAGCSEQALTYDALGRKRSESIWKACGTSGGTTTFSYDAFGRVTSVTTPDSKTSTVGYLGSRVITRSSEVGSATVSTSEEYDVFGRLASVTENAGTPEQSVTTTYTYDVGDRLTSVNMPGENGTQQRAFTYDNRGFLLSEKHPELGLNGNGTTTYSNYDARGHARRKSTGTFDVTMIYDAAERLTSLKETNSQRELKTFVYDSFGQCTTPVCLGKLVAAARYHYDGDLGDPATTQLAVTESYGYDAATGRPVRRDRTVGSISGRFTGASFFHTQTYDSRGNALTTSYPCASIDGGCDFAQRQFSVTNAYTKGLLTSVGTYASAISYQPSGIISSVTHGSGTAATTESWTADPNKLPRPRKITLTNNAGTVLWTTGDYTYDGSGNVTGIGNATYGYDAFSRLSTITTTAGAAYTAESRSYDNFGNYLFSSYKYCTANPDGTRGPCAQTATQPRPVAGTTNRYADLTYDTAGNVTRDDQTPDAPRRYAYDATGMMTSYKRDEIDFRYLYTPDDERIAAVQRITGSDGIIRNKTTFTLRNFNNQLLSVFTMNTGSSTLQWKEDEIWRGSALLARRTPSAVTHYALDHLGSPRAITNSSGALVGTQEFTPFGTGGTSNSGALQFTAHERDAANLLNGTESMPDYMHARYYDVDGGRFLSVDPAGYNPKRPQSWNRYAYVMNNPVNNSDPDGRETNPVTGKSYIRDDQILNSARNPDKGHWGNTRTERDGTTPKWHGGNDLAAPKGTPIFAPVSGTVVQSGYDAQYGGGWVLRIRRATKEDGKTVYIHMSHLNAQPNVQVGDTVVEGQPNVAQVGNSGNAKDEPPHVHTSVMVGGTKREHQRDPQQWFRDHPSNAKSEKSEAPCEPNSQC